MFSSIILLFSLPNNLYLMTYIVYTTYRSLRWGYLPLKRVHTLLGINRADWQIYSCQELLFEDTLYLPVRVSSRLVHWCLSSVFIYWTYYILQVSLPSGPYWHLAMPEAVTLCTRFSASCWHFWLFFNNCLFPVMLGLAKSSLQAKCTILPHFHKSFWWLKG